MVKTRTLSDPEVVRDELCTVGTLEGAKSEVIAPPFLGPLRFLLLG